MENDPLETSEKLFQIHSSPRNELILIEVLVIGTFSLLVIHGGLGYCKRRIYCRPLKYVGLGLNLTIAALIPYILGLMRNSNINHELVSTWAAFLVFVYAGVDHYILLVNDNLINWLYPLAKFILYVVYAISLIPSVKKHSVLFPLIFLVVTSFLRLVITFVHPRSTLSSLCEIWDEQQKVMVSSSSEVEVVNRRDSALRGCRYVVNPRHRKEVSTRETTVQDIWCCQDGLILCSEGEEAKKRSDHMKRTCLSFSFFWLLVHKFVGVQLYGRKDQKDEAWTMVRQGLFEDGSIIPDPLEVIEDELTFLGDLLTNKDFFLYNRIGFLWYPVAQGLYIGCLFWIVFIIFINYDPRKQAIRIQYHNHDVEVLVTGIVSICIVIWEVRTFIGTLSSPRWVKVALICTYVNRSSWNNSTIWDWCITKAAYYFCKPCRRCCPWGRQLQQYSLLDSCRCFENFDKVLPVKALLYCTRGVIYMKGITLSDEVKNKVTELLKKRGRSLTNGIDSLPNMLKWAIPETHTDDQVILIWHIATSMCEMDTAEARREQENFRVAKSLSQYCAYLVAFFPELLPGNATITEHTCTTTIQEASSILKDCNEGADIYKKLVDVASKPTDVKAGQEDVDVEAGQEDVDVEAGKENNNVEAYQAKIKKYGTIMQQGALLGIELSTHVVDLNERWELLANFWVEKILYLAPNIGNERAHAKRLLEGGEFITHLWVLLSHAGIVGRDCFRNNNDDGGGEEDEDDGGGDEDEDDGDDDGSGDEDDDDDDDDGGEGRSTLVRTSSQYKAEKSTATATTSAGEIELGSY